MGISVRRTVIWSRRQLPPTAVCMRVHVCVCLCVRACVCLCVHVFVSAHACVCVCMCVPVFVYSLPSTEQGTESSLDTEWNTAHVMSLGSANSLLWFMCNSTTWEL